MTSPKPAQEMCKWCEGYGKIIPRPSGLFRSETCPRCYGTGKTPAQPLEQHLDRKAGEYLASLPQPSQGEAQSKSVQKRIAAQNGLPNPFDVQGKAQVRLARYGIKWQSENMPICVPFPDGYWTPWHVAEAQVASLTEERDRIAADLRAEEKGQDNLRRCVDKLTADNEALRLQLKHDVSPLQAALEELAAAQKDAARYRFLTNLPKVQAQAFFWNWDSRKDRAKAIDAAMTK